MRRALRLLPLLLVPMLAGCAPGALGPSDAEPSPSSSPAASPSTSPTPSATTDDDATTPGQRFDGVDIAAALEPVPFEPGDPERWGDWSTAPREEIVPGIDPAAFANQAGCTPAIESIAAIQPREVVGGGYPYDGEQVASVVVGRMASVADADAYLDALVTASIACDGLTVDSPDGLVALWDADGLDPVVAEAGIVGIATIYDGSFEGGYSLLGSIDELVVLGVGPSGPSAMGWEVLVVDAIEQQISALEAAAA